jgi:hypothetical protein
MLPILEAYELTGDVRPEDVDRSLRAIFQELQSPEGEAFLARSDVSTGKRSTSAVIRAFWRRFCSIPPFCGPAR